MAFWLQVTFRPAALHSGTPIASSNLQTSPAYTLPGICHPNRLCNNRPTHFTFEVHFMESSESAKPLIASMKEFLRASLLDSDDVEHDAAIQMLVEAKSLLDQFAANDPRLAELLKQYETDVDQIEAEA
jgi:hypothetical protein